ncbi:MAG: hypothetical protein EOO01_28150 [Chitinophagaceae bacterium]|nr:MAG: hypothetical protein EOO01_28150 [Chitinophagaceae bacterium]
MHELEPFYNWQHLYLAEEDEQSPLFGKEHSEFEFSNTVYNYYIHPQWDEFGSRTLYLKILFADYDQNFAIIELIGEWNDAVENDVMQLKRSIIDQMIAKGIYKYILICENVLNFHSSDESYYEEWNDDIKDEGGWIVMLNMPEHSHEEIRQARISRYVFLMDYVAWRTHLPQHLYQLVDNRLLRLLD